VHLTLTVVANEAHLPEPVHEEAHPRPSGAHHLGQSFLTDLGNCNFRLSVLAEVSQQEENASQPLFAGIKKLVNQIRFVSDASMFLKSRVVTLCSQKDAFERRAAIHRLGCVISHIFKGSLPICPGIWQ
jgi:hypothetical protein